MIFWYILTLLAEPEYWGVIGVCFVALYLLLKKTPWGKKPGLKVFKKFVIIFMISLFISFGIVQVLKLGLQVPRICTPCPAPDCNSYCLPDYSFPSGHAATAFVLFTSLYTVIRKKRFLPLFIVPILMSLSRIMLGVHTYTDVFAGALIGILVTFGVWKKRGCLTAKTAKRLFGY